MKYYLAPMEGITGFVYRNAYEKYFHNIDKYFTPFIVPNVSNSFKTKELKDVLPENNTGMYVVPQILTNDATGFTNTARKLQQLGYNEINLNLGCPSGTVVSKNRGSGFLALVDELDKFLEEIYKIDDMKISVKTRIGKDSPDEFYKLMEMYNKYPMEELIIHPRTQKDYYGNKPNLEMFRHAVEISKNPICYNGDIFTAEDFKRINKEFPEVNSMMFGRGLLSNPGIIDEIKNDTYLDKQVLREFHDEVLYGYIKLFNEDRNAFYRMKELWAFMIHMFPDSKKYLKRIKKAQKLEIFNEAVDDLLEDRDILKGAGLFTHED